MYKRTIWQDHVEGIQVGTDMNAANFNNIEVGTMEANALAALNSEYQRYENDASKNNNVYIMSRVELNGANTIHSINFPTNATRNYNIYTIIPQIVSVENGTAGDIIPVTLQANGFTVKYTGTASMITVKFAIMGGMYYVS